MESLIRGLLVAGSPPDIAWLIIPIVVDSIDRVFPSRPHADRGAHIRNEGREIPPTTTDANPPAPIPWVAGGLAVLASLHHAGPDSKQGVRIVAWGHTVLTISLDGDLLV